jgi:hypothetical protein
MKLKSCQQNHFCWLHLNPRFFVYTRMNDKLKWFPPTWETLMKVQSTWKGKIWIYYESATTILNFPFFCGSHIIIFRHWQFLGFNFVLIISREFYPKFGENIYHFFVTDKLFSACFYCYLLLIWIFVWGDHHPEAPTPKRMVIELKARLFDKKLFLSEKSNAKNLGI